MKKLLISGLFIVALLQIQAQKIELSGEYLGQKKPGLTPELFAPNFISPKDSKKSAFLHPNGKEFYYTIVDRKFENYSIMVTKLEGDKWSNPQPLLKGDAMVPAITKDGQKLYYSSIELTDENDTRKEPNLWVMERDQDVWIDPKPLGTGVNTPEAGEWFPSIADDGTLYFKKSDFRESSESIYSSNITDEKHQKSIFLDAPFNAKFNTEDPYVAPDKSYVIFNPGGPDLYGPMHISFINKEGNWSSPKDMGLKGALPSLSPDRKYLFFIKDDDVYWVDAQIIETLKFLAD